MRATTTTKLARLLLISLALLFAATAAAKSARLELRLRSPSGQSLPTVSGDKITLAPPFLSTTTDQVKASTHGRAVDLCFAPTAAKTLREVTAGHLGQTLAIVLDGVVHAEPTIMAAISGGCIEITPANPAQAEQLGRLLNN